MSGRITPLAVSLVIVVAWAVALAVLTARPEPFVAALPLILVLVLATRRRAPAVTVTHEVSAARVIEGEALTITVTVQTPSSVPFVEVLDAVPAGCEAGAGRHRALLALDAGGSASLRYDLHAARGAHELGTVALRARDRWGLRAWDSVHTDRKVVRVYPRAVPLRSLPRPLRTQSSVGDYVSPALGEGIEPGDVRQFAPGDRLRLVNWRASLRLGTLYVTQHHRERNADVVLMLDTLAQAGPAGDDTLDHSVRAVASLATAYLARKDRVGLITYGGTIDWVRPATGRLQYARIADTLLRADVVFTYVSKDLAFVPPRVLPPRAMVLAVTPLLDARFATAALDLAARGFDLAVLVVSPVDLTLRMLRGSPAERLACRLWELERRAGFDRFRRHGITVMEWRPSDPLEPALAAHGRRRRPRVAG
ncbi:MAG TPA: DUF58 domain-containing protein [Terriglobales bacterium]|nr:DUF58 domain-containing protein [Terriglobales bacterium]